MALVLCPSCGEESLDRLLNCPACNTPLSEGESRMARREKTLRILGITFVAGAALATLLNIAGFFHVAIAFGIVGLLGLVGFILKLNATN